MLVDKPITTIENFTYVSPFSTQLIRYQGIKRKFTQEIVFLRNGDFFEAFGADAAQSAPVLQIPLTKSNQVPTCGFHHSKQKEIAQTLTTKLGKTLAFVEQISERKYSRKCL